jgi:hypothetical protein
MPYRKLQIHKLSATTVIFFTSPMGHDGMFAFLGRRVKTVFTEGEQPAGQGRSGAPQKSGRLPAHGLL